MGGIVRIAVITTIMDGIDNLIVRGVPVTSLIVELDDTLAIIDTGMAGNPELLEQLNDLGCRPSDFGLVFNTHLHPDHIGGNRHFPHARIIVSHRELAYHQSLEALAADAPENALMRQVREIREQYPVSEWIGDPGRIEFLEDHPRLPPGIELIPAPGHSIDDHAVLLQGRTHTVLATGDALYHRDLWRGPSLPGLNYDEDLFRRSAGRLSAFDGIIVPGHDRAFDNATGAYERTNTFIPL